MNSLQEQIEEMSKSIKTDSYPMSIGELAGLYKDGDLNISPVYQRLFRWDIDQQSALIESILLQIPIPPIYVYQSEDGKWSVIDGQQRLSTIFKFMGILRRTPDDSQDEELEIAFFQREPLTKTKFLPALEGKYWEDKDTDNSLTDAQRRYIKRSKILIIIIDKSSDTFAQYEMFQRLNTGGSHLSPQEIRNCILVMQNEQVYYKFKQMSDYPNFLKSIPLSEKDTEEQGYIELVVKFIILRYSKFEVSDSENYNNFITDEILRIIECDDLDYEAEQSIFEETFDLMQSVMGENGFKKFDAEKGKHMGTVLVGAYEIIIPGLTKYYEYYKEHNEELKEKIEALYTSTDNEYSIATERGVRPVARMKKLAKASKEIFNVNSDKND